MMTYIPPEADGLVRVVQTVQTREGPWRIEVVGRVVNRRPQPTGSWFAREKDDRLWLNRLRLQKEDGEIVDLVVDESTKVIPLRPGRVETSSKESDE